MRHSFHTPAPLAVELRLPAGAVRLASVDGEETTVELEPLDDDPASLQAVESARVERLERDGRRILQVEVPGRDAEVELRVRAPHGADVRVRTASADVEAAGRWGSVRVETASGDVEVGHAAGELSVDTASGDVRVDEARGAASFALVSGDLRVGESGASLRASTVSGDQWLESVAGGHVELESVSGELRVGIRQGCRVWVDASSRSGDTTSELEVSDEPPDGEAPLLELRARTVSGDVRLVRATR